MRKNSSTGINRARKYYFARFRISRTKIQIVQSPHVNTVRVASSTKFQNPYFFMMVSFVW